MSQQWVEERYWRYHPETLDFSPRTALSSDGFLLKLRLQSPVSAAEEKRTVWELPGVLRLTVGVWRKGVPDSDYEQAELWSAMAGGADRCPLLNAELFLENERHPQWSRMTMGLPLSLYDAVSQPVYLLYDGVRLAWIVQGEQVNRIDLYGRLGTSSAPVSTDPLLAEWGVSTTVDALPRESMVETVERSMAFHTPRGCNTWAGDAMNFYHNGRYHLLYLEDRHHHSNCFGQGAHHAVHLSTTDFKHWEHHGEIVPRDRMWKTVGTGTMVYHKQKYYFIYGHHTSRFLPDEQLGSPVLRERYERDGVVTAVPYDELAEQGRVPNGSHYMVSEDGITFVPGEKQIHWCENPSVYVENGELTLYAGYGGSGVWQAPDVDGPWRELPNRESFQHRHDGVRSSDECASMFEWNGYRYVLRGFTGFWMTERNGTVFRDMAVLGDDIYDGLCVPMVVNADGRYLLTGWLAGYGWGFVLQHRELVQKADGRLGLRWIPEFTPDVTRRSPVVSLPAVTSGAVLPLDGRRTCYMECQVTPGANARVGFGFEGEGSPFVLELNTATRKVQAKRADRSDTFTEPVPALYELVPTLPDTCQYYSQIPSDDLHFKSRDFAIAHVEELEQPYTLKLLLYYEPKSDSMVLDAEIGGSRTLISNRCGFRPSSVRLFFEDAAVTDCHLFTGETGTLQELLP